MTLKLYSELGTRFYYALKLRKLVFSLKAFSVDLGSYYKKPIYSWITFPYYTLWSRFKKKGCPLYTVLANHINLASELALFVPVNKECQHQMKHLGD